MIRWALGLVFVVAPVPLTALSQAPRGAESLSPAAVADSQAVLRTLDEHVRANPKDAAGWYRRGMVAWALADRARATPPVRGLDVLRMGRLADTSLRIAAQVEPTNTKYNLAAGKYLRSPPAFPNPAAEQFFEAALASARVARDSALIATAALEAGRVFWLRYETMAYRRMVWQECEESNSPKSSIDSAALRTVPVPPRVVDVTVQSLQPRRGPATAERDPTPVAMVRLLSAFAECTFPVEDAGEGDYLKAEALFREAYTADPLVAGVFHQLAMLLADHVRWPELIVLAREHIGRNPSDPQAWFTLGLAQQRTGASAQAITAFESALTRTDTRERGRLFALERLLDVPDSARYHRADSNAKTSQERTLWLVNDPLWSRKDEDPRTEFIARVAYAELRWTVPEMGVRGADSDRGRVHIRYGPPDNIGVVSKPARLVTYWYYDHTGPYNGFVVVFWSAPTYGTAHYPNEDREHIEEIIRARPTSFDNIAATRFHDLTLQTARFRAGDSVDVLVIGRAPMDTLRAAAAANSPVRAFTWLVARDFSNTVRDSMTLPVSGIGAWVYRVPQSTYLFRAEAFVDGSLAAARVMATIVAGRDTASGFATTGNGISDLVLSSTVQPRTATPRRWGDFSITPLIGAMRAGGTIGLLWENYEFGARAGRATYTAEVTIERRRGVAGRIAAEIMSRVAGTIGVDRRDDRVTMRFERAIPHAVALVDQVTVGLGTTPPGEYLVTLRITDRVSGRVATRSTNLVIVP